MNDRAANKQLSFDQLDSGVAPVAEPASVPGPHYTVRVSPRARRLQLKVSPLGKVEVVAPHRVAAKDVHVFVERHGQWLQRTLARLSAVRARAWRRWLQRHALTTLASLLRETSIATDLPYTALSVRAQRSRWGSCSSGGNISLNRNLLFLPPALARFVNIHELCHTLHMNLCVRFWRLVQRHASDIRERERELRHGDRYIPAWALPD